MQLKTSSSIKFFHDIFKNKFGFSEYLSRDNPTVFFGIYHDNDWRAIRNHRGIKIFWLAGTDSSITLDAFKKGVVKKEDFDNATVIAESTWVAKDLDEIGIKYERITLCMDNIYNWKPTPLGKSLYWYNAGSSKYGKQYLSAVRAAFPDLDIITNDAHSTPREKMHEVYAQCFASVRPVEHDGMSQTVAEMSLMGRMSIYNGDGPFSMPFKGQEGLIEAIRRLRVADYNYRLVARRARGFFIEGEIKWCNLILRLCGTDELDVAHIFDEDPKRSASFFRIQRKSDIEKIGGLGDSQYERPWYCQKMHELGKRQLIASKNSGFIAREWKNDGNKGYEIDNYLTNKKKI